MYRPASLLLLLHLLAQVTVAQNVGIGTTTPNASAVLEVNSADKGILIPRMLAAQRLLITPVDGLMVYDIDSSSLFIYEQTAWKRLRAISNLQTLITGVNPNDVLVWNGTNWVVTPKCSLFTYYFRDADGDGRGDKYRPVYGCSALPGFVADSTDCDDTNPFIFSGATETCNGIDDDCDGIVDEGCIFVSPAGNGNGTVSSSPAGINCPGDCNESFGIGNTITLSASPAVGSTFTGWSGGGCSGTGTCAVTIPNAATTISATFTLQQFNLSVSNAGTGGGTVTSVPAGINCPGDCSEMYNYNTMVTLTAVPDANSTFTGWSGAGCSGTGTCVVTMDAAKSVTANFSIQQFNLSVGKAGNGSGTITSTPAGINCGADCNELYNANTMVTLTASPAAGSTFTGWSGAGCTGTGSCVVTMDAAKSVTATFTLQQFNVTVFKSGTGSGTVTSSPAGISCGADCTEVYNYGTAVMLTATPASGSTFAGWSGGCTGTGTCIVNVTAATSVNATFTLNSYPLTVTKSGSGSGTVTSSPAGINCGTDCSENYGHGTVVVLTANATTGNFAGWSGGGCSGTGVCMVTMLSATSVTATFNIFEPEPSPMALHRNLYYKEERIELYNKPPSLQPGSSPALRMAP